MHVHFTEIKNKWQKIMSKWADQKINDKKTCQNGRIKK
jgi:hypothetical protein